MSSRPGHTIRGGLSTSKGLRAARALSIGRWFCLLGSDGQLDAISSDRLDYRQWHIHVMVKEATSIDDEGRCLTSLVVDHFIEMSDVLSLAVVHYRAMAQYDRIA
jgi:hypothetical protein